MGTRHLVAVMHDGAYKIAQYGQWDGYMEGQGVTVLKFCRRHLSTPELRAKFIEKLALCRYVSDEQIKAWYREVGADDSGWVNMNVANAFKREHPSLNRDMGAQILNYVRRSRAPVDLRDETSFAADSLYCEWAYVVDLDRRVLEVYRGFNEEPLAAWERFAGLPRAAAGNGSPSPYFPVRRVFAFSLDDLPTRRLFLRVAGELLDEENSKYEAEHAAST